MINDRFIDNKEKIDLKNGKVRKCIDIDTLSRKNSLKNSIRFVSSIKHLEDKKVLNLRTGIDEKDKENDYLNTDNSFKKIKIVAQKKQKIVRSNTININKGSLNNKESNNNLNNIFLQGNLNN